MPMGRLESKQRKPWWLHVIAIGIGVAAFLCSLRFGYDWTSSIATAAGSLIFPAVIYYRKVGKHNRFWETLSLLTILQVPLVIAARPLVEQFRFVFLLAFGFGDCVLVAFVLNWMCPSEKLG